MEQYIIDIILAVIFLFSVFSHFRKGFGKSFIKAASILLSGIIAKVFSSQVTDWFFKNTSLFASTNRYISKLIISVFMFLFVGGILLLVGGLLDNVLKLPVIKQANKLLGALLGAIIGGITVIILCVVLQISSHVVYNSKYVNAVENSKIVQTVLSDEKIEENIKLLK